MQVIQKVTALSIPPREFEVGTEVDGREVIEIKRAITEPYSDFSVIDEDGNLIATIENCPVIVNYKEIAEHGEIPKRVFGTNEK